MSVGDAVRVALVTGGEKGIGRGVVERLLADGWRVAIAGIDEAEGAELVSRSEALFFVPCDVSDEDRVSAAVSLVLSRWGRLDGLVANAGIASPERVAIEELERSEWDRVLSVNLTGVFLCVKHAAAALRAAGGSVVTIASTRAHMSEPNTFAYSASKGGIVALTHCLANSLGPEVRVNSVSPGWIHNGSTDALRTVDHEQHLVGRVGRPADIAGMVAYLLGSESGFVTGQDFVVDGGMTKKMIYEH